MSHSELLDFINFGQNFHPAVKFTYDISERLVAFRDTDSSLKQGKLTTFAHYKATDSNSYQDYSSSNKPSTKEQHPIFPVSETLLPAC